MKLFSTLLVSSLLCAAGSHAANEKTATLIDATGKNVGQVKLSEDKKGVKVSLDLKGAQPGMHGMHFHKIGKCEGPDFKSAGDHFNPTQKQHGKLNTKGPHLGDLPNINIPKSGDLKEDVVAEGVSLDPKKSASLASAEGSALVIHAAQDDYKTDPSGNSGDRLYCAVLFEGKAKTK